MAFNPFSIFRSRTKNAVGGGYYFPFGMSASGKAVNEKTAMSTTAVYACVRVLAEAVAGLPVHIYKYTDDGGKIKTPQHGLYRLLHDAPNSEMTSFVFRETLMTHLLLWGNAYAQIVRNGKGEAIALYPLLPAKMTVDRDKTGQLIYSYQADNGTLTLSRHEVLHIPGLGFDGIIGYSPIALAKQAVGTALAVEEFGARFFSNGANPSGVLEHPGIIKPEQADRLRSDWRSKFNGGNAHSIAVLEDGMKFHQMSIPPEQAQFIETRKYSATEIARIFRVPPHMIADLDRATFSNIEHQSLEFVKYSLQPWVTRWEQSLQQALVLPSERTDVFIRFNLDGMLRGAYKERMDGYAVGINNGFMSPNDVRELENINRIEGGDVYMVNGTMTPLENIGAAYNLNKEQ